MPAGTELFGAASVLLFDEPPGISGVLDGEGVNGVEKGWAADVEVAASGDSGARWREDVVRVRRGRERGMEESLRVQRRQIIVVIVVD